jgi:hypothetical protein
VETTKKRIQIMINLFLATEVVQIPAVIFFAIIFIGACLIKNGGDGFPKF